MAKTKTEIALRHDWNKGLLVQRAAAILDEEIPEHLKKDAAESFDGLSRIIQPPRLKVLQAQKDKMFDAFTAGTTVMMPEATLVAAPDEPIWFVPVLYWPEWIVVNPIELKNIKPYVVDRTLDPTHKIAKIAQDSGARDKQPCPDMAGKNLRYKEVLNYLVIIVGNATVGSDPVLMSFKSGEHKMGRHLASIIKARVGVSPWHCVFEAKVPSVVRRNEKGSWYGWDITNPTSEGRPAPWVKGVEEAKYLEDLHHSLKQSLADKMIDVVYDEPDPASPSAENSQF